MWANRLYNINWNLPANQKRTFFLAMMLKTMSPYTHTLSKYRFKYTKCCHIMFKINFLSESVAFGFHFLDLHQVILRQALLPYRAMATVGRTINECTISTSWATRHFMSVCEDMNQRSNTFKRVWVWVGLSSVCLSLLFCCGCAFES